MSYELRIPKSEPRRLTPKEQEFVDDLDKLLKTTSSHILTIRNGLEQLEERIRLAEQFPTAHFAISPERMAAVLRELQTQKMQYEVLLKGQEELFQSILNLFPVIKKHGVN